MQRKQFLQVAVNAPLTSTLHENIQTGGQFTLKQNYPNPFGSATTIPFTLLNAADVTIEVFDMNARKIAVLCSQRYDAGDHKVTFNRTIDGAALPEGNYVYQITTDNSNGTFRQAIVMTVA
jgi:flagellar hook assembly protein FlgD